MPFKLFQWNPTHSSHPVKIAASPQVVARCCSQTALNMLPEQYALSLRALPVAVIEKNGSKELTVATDVGREFEVERALQFSLGVSVKVVTLPGNQLLDTIHFAYRGSDNALKTSLSRVKESPQRNVHDDLPTIRQEAGDINRVLTTIIDYAIAKNATDIHLFPRINGSFVRLRISGELLTHTEPLFSLESHKQLINRIKILSSLDISQHALPQEGRITIPLPTRSCFARVSIMPTVHGEKAVLRLAATKGILTLNELGLEDDLRELLLSIIKKRTGLIVLSGPTGSGKSALMYALANEIHGEARSIVTVEDPVETLVDWACQISLDPQGGLDYQKALRSVLRQDPDVLLIGEVRDAESAHIALHAAQTGHLVLTTVHSTDIFGVLNRFEGLGVNKENLVPELSLIMSLRLLPRLCINCSVLDLLGSKRYRFEVKRPVGCSFCDHSGYSGLVLSASWLHITEDVVPHLLTIDKADSLLKTHYHSHEASLVTLLREGKIGADTFRNYQ